MRCLTRLQGSSNTLLLRAGAAAWHKVGLCVPVHKVVLSTPAAAKQLRSLWLIK